MEELIKAYAPASIGNVIVGFDVLGLAVKEPGDEVGVKLNDNQKTQIVSISKKTYHLVVAWVAALQVL